MYGWTTGFPTCFPSSRKSLWKSTPCRTVRLMGRLQPLTPQVTLPFAPGTPRDPKGTVPAVLHPLAGSWGIGVCAGWMRSLMSTMGVWTVVCKELGRHLQGFCQCTGIMLVSPFISLSSPFSCSNELGPDRRARGGHVWCGVSPRPWCTVNLAGGLFPLLPIFAAGAESCR